MNTEASGAQAPGTRNYRWVILSICFLVSSIGVGFQQFTIPTLAPVFSEDLGISLAAALGIYSAIRFSLIFGQSIGGVAGDRYPLKWVVGGGTILIGFTMIWRWALPGYYSQIIASLVFGIGNGLVFPNLIKTLGDWFDPSSVGFAQGINMVGFNLGCAVSGSVSAGIMLNLSGSWERVFLVSGSLAIIVGTIWIFFAGSPSTTHAENNSSESVNSNESEQKNGWGEFLALATETNNLFLYGIALLVFYMVIGFSVVVPSWVEALPFEISEFYKGTPLYAGTVGALVIPTLSDYLRRKPIFVTSAGIGLLGGVVCIFARSFFWFVSGMAVAGVFFGGMLALLYTLPAQLPNVRSDQTGTVSGLLLSFGQIGGSTSPVLAGYFLDQFDSLVLSGVSLLIPVLFLPPCLYFLRIEEN